MAYIDIRVNVPDGEYCGYCSFNPRGTVVCELFDEFIEETEDNNKIKCEECKKRCKQEGDN